jgi:hypothetical protein
MLSLLLERMKDDLHKSMKQEVNMRKSNNLSGKIYEVTIAVKDVVRSIISRIPELGVKPDKATDDDIIKLLKKYVVEEKTRELYIQHILRPSQVVDITAKQLNYLQKEKINELGDKLNSMKISIAQSYLPKEIGEAQIINWITKNVDFNKLKNKMQAIGMVKKEFGQTVNPMLVKNIVENWFK